MSRYRPGEALAIAGLRTVVLLPQPADPALAVMLWKAARSDANLEAYLAVLLGGGLAGLPPFGLLHADATGTVALLRGDVILNTPGRSLSGTQVTTWTEHRLPTTTRATLSLDASLTGEWLPMLAGMVYVSAIELEGVDDGVSAGPASVAESGVVIGSREAAHAEGREPIEQPPAPPLSQRPAAEPLTGTATPLAAVAVGQPPPAAVPAAQPRVAPAPVPPASISVPGARPSPSEEPSVSTPAEPQHADRSTVLITGIPTRLRPGGTPVPDTPAAPQPQAAPGDHDGYTVRREEVAELQTATVRRAPETGRIRFADGRTVRISHGLVLGREPMFHGSGGYVLEPLQVPSPKGDVSRSHLEIRANGGAVVVTDLGSTNGTEIAVPGQLPERLRPRQPRVIEPGTTVNLAGEVTFVYETEQSGTEQQ